MTNTQRLKDWAGIAATAIAIATATGVVIVKLLDLETREAHAQDIARVELKHQEWEQQAAQTRQWVWCLLSEIPKERCRNILPPPTY